MEVLAETLLLFKADWYAACSSWVKCSLYGNVISLKHKSFWLLIGRNKRPGIGEKQKKIQVVDQENPLSGLNSSALDEKHFKEQIWKSSAGQSPLGLEIKK